MTEGYRKNLEAQANALRGKFVVDGHLNWDVIDEFRRFVDKNRVYPVLGDDNRLHIQGEQ